MTEREDIYQAAITMFSTRDWSFYATCMSKFFIHIQRWPDTITHLVRMVLDELPQGGTFFDAALSFLPMEQWPEVVQMAVTALWQKADHKAAQQIISYASLQCPQAVHPYLEQLFPLMGDDLLEAFREVNLEQVRFLFGASPYRKSPYSEKLVLSQAFRALLETRLPEALAFVRSHDDEHLSYYLSSIGFEETPEGFRQLYSPQVLHLAFSPDYLSQLLSHSTKDEDKCHPTWGQADTHASRYRFGGQSNTRCGTCGERAHHLITLDPVPPSLGVTELPRIELVVCLSCLGWEQSILSYQHDENGKPKNIRQSEIALSPQFPAEPLKETEVNLLERETRWRWQDWGRSNGRENLHRVGGHPTWIQHAEYPRCPLCGKTSTFLMQLDSYLPTSDEGEWLWGSGGIGYVFWCDGCKVTSFLFQCT